MKKTEAIKEVLQQGSFSVSEIAQKTGIKPTIVSVYLNHYSEAWGVTKTGLRKSYRYGIGAASSGGEAGEAVAEQA